MAETALKKWEPKHERMALLSAAGTKSKDIAEMFGVSEVWVFKVLQDPRAMKVKADFVRELRDRLLQKFDDQVLVLAGLALKNLKRTLSVHLDPETQRVMKQHQDRISIDILKLAGLGHAERPAGATIQLTREESQVLVEAIRTADKAKEIYDADFEVINDEPNGKATSSD